MTTKGTYSLVGGFDYTLEVDYTYYWDDGNYTTPPEEELEITKATLDGMDITSFFYDFIEDSFSDEIKEHAQEHKHD